MNTSPDERTQAVRRRFFRLHPNVFFLGIVSLLTDVSSEMIFTLVPLFLRNVLGSPTTVVGLVGGISESADALFRIASGWVSDRIGQRKLLAVLGYGLSTLVKPFMYLASSRGPSSPYASSTASGRGCGVRRGTPLSPTPSPQVSGAGDSAFTGQWIPPGRSSGWRLPP